MQRSPQGSDDEAAAPEVQAVVNVPEAVERLLGTLELNEAGEAKAAIARSLAAKLDEVAVSNAATSYLAAPAIAKELREVLDAILESTGETEEFVADLFAEVGNAANTKPANAGRRRS